MIKMIISWNLSILSTFLTFNSLRRTRKSTKIRFFSPTCLHIHTRTYTYPRVLKIIISRENKSVIVLCILKRSYADEVFVKKKKKGKCLITPSCRKSCTLYKRSSTINSIPRRTISEREGSSINQRGCKSRSIMNFYRCN